MRDLAWVAVGGAVGAVARFAVSTWLPRLDFPWHTLLVNLLGAFVLGFAMVAPGLEHGTRLWLAVGLLGSFTTLSTFGFETVEMLREGRHVLAGINVFANGLGGPVAVWLGWQTRTIWT